MAGQLAHAVSHFLDLCPHVVAVHDLVTKVRVELPDDCFLDLYYNATLGKYTYALICQGRRVYCWDNAPHHPGLKNYPHHFHCENGSIEPSSFTGDPEQDIAAIAAIINNIW